ncbi:MAG: DUF2059 domain-containing protein [Rhodobacteraceae bacterium]|nr:DUF2059 domain-containing protein [Paracoccaceae bacterium]
MKNFALSTVLTPFAVTAAAYVAFAGPVVADTDALMDAMQIPTLLEIMAEEGVVHSADLEEELFPNRGGAGWRLVTGNIYNIDRMQDEFATRFDAGLTDAQAEVLTEFFASPRGARIVQLEIDARRAFLDETLEEAAIDAYNAARQEDADADALAPLERFVEANDLVESNVMGALNSNYAFYQGLNDGGAFPRRMSEGEILADVWSQEDEIRADSTEWVYSYLSLAYGPLEEGDLDVYTALSESAEGRALNSALFGAFDDLFTRISRELGEAAAGFVVGQDL